MKLSIFILLLFCISCKPVKTNIFGRYSSLTDFNTDLFLDSAKKFVFTRTNSSAALLAGEKFIRSHGTWYVDANNIVILQSEEKNLNSFSIREDSAKQKDKSKFTFLTSAGDTLGISLYSLNGKLYGKVHGVESDVNVAIQKGDSLTFSFPGFQEYRFTKTDFRKSDYIVTLYPIYDGQYFSGARFHMRSNSLIGINSSSKFKKRSR